MSRALTLNADARREIDAAIREIADDKRQKAVDRLCAMRGHLASPDVRGRHKDELSTLRLKVARLERELAQATTAAQVMTGVAREASERPVRSQPKPSRRVVDRDVIGEFRAQNPQCCITTCRAEPADPHHVWPRGRGGNDCPACNLVPLCRNHHDEVERIDNEAFRTKYASRLPDPVLFKMKLAMMLEAEKKLAQRPAIDLDEERA